MQYIKIKQAIAEQIDSGLLAARQKLPSERKLAESFNTTRVTLREALSLLEVDGKIYREDRRGWFISPQPLRFDPSRDLSISRISQQQSRALRTELISAQSILADKEASKLLKLAPFSDVYSIDRVRFLEERPVAYATSYAKTGRFVNLLEHDLSCSISNLYVNHYDVVFHKMGYRISTTTLVGDIALALRSTEGAQAVVVERVYYDGSGESVCADITYWRHDAISIESVTELS